MPNQDLVQAVRKSLSPARLETFEIATAARDDEDLAALDLYAWNARVSAAILAPLHLCEEASRLIKKHIRPTLGKLPLSSGRSPRHPSAASSPAGKHRSPSEN